MTLSRRPQLELMIPARLVSTINWHTATRQNLPRTLRSRITPRRILDDSNPLTLDPITEDSGAPVGSVGTLVSSLVDLTGGGGLDNVTDADSGGLTGIAVTQAATGMGTWYYSIDDGANWNLLVGATNNNSLLLAADSGSRLYFEPNANFTGLAVNPLNFRAWDQTSGTNGSFADTTVNGGTSAFSSVVEFVSVPVTAVNDAPVAIIVASAFGVTEDDGYRLLGGFSVSDVDAGGSDIAFTLSVGQGTINLTNTTGLTLAAGANDSATMTFTGSVSNINTALGTVTYKPDANFNGTDTIALSVDDQGNAGSGGPLSDADGANIVVSARNDAPTLNDGFIVGLPGADEDSATVGTTVAAIVDNASWSDIDVGAVKGMAVTSVSGNGTWQYSTDGLTWNSFGAVSITNTLLLNATTQVRYVGDGANGEIASFDFRAWDTTTGTASTNVTPAYADPGFGGGTSAFSSEVATANTTVTSLNDAPLLDNTRSDGSAQCAKKQHGSERIAGIDHHCQRRWGSNHRCRSWRRRRNRGHIGRRWQRNLAIFDKRRQHVDRVRRCHQWKRRRAY